MAATYPFLSDEWVEAARALRAEYADRVPEIPFNVRMNLVIGEVPFGDGVVDAHLDTSTGELELEVGHLADPDLTMTVEYDTARAIFVEGDPQVAMGAFLGGRIKVDGDITKLLTLQSSGVVGGGIDPVAVEAFTRLRDLTA